MLTPEQSKNPVNSLNYGVFYLLAPERVCGMYSLNHQSLNFSDRVVAAVFRAQLIFSLLVR